MKKIAILQSNYIPWKGYFDLISAVDEFVIFDEMQFTKKYRRRTILTILKFQSPNNLDQPFLSETSRPSPYFHDTGAKSPSNFVSLPI